MIPVSGSYAHFCQQVECVHKNDRGRIGGSTLGLLFVDGRQQNIREYIINYLPDFNISSANYIDFYIPGYGRRHTEMDIYGKRGGNIEWNFDPELYYSFQNEMYKHHKISPSTTAYLLLLEYEAPGRFRRTMQIQLDGSAVDPKDAGRFMYKLFEYTHQTIEFEDIRNWVMKEKIIECIKRQVLPKLPSLGISYLLETFVLKAK